MDAALVNDIQSKCAGKDTQDFPEIRTGMEVEVHQRVTEGGKSRIQIFKGLVINVSGKTFGEKTFTVRRVVNNHGIEKIYPFSCPTIEKVVVKRQYKVRRKNIKYIRDLKGNAARLKEKKAATPAKKK